jgi:hypothetical protein
MPNDHAGWVLLVTDGRNHTAADDLAPWIEADVGYDVADLRAVPFCETARQPLHVILDREPPAALDRTALRLAPVPRGTELLCWKLASFPRLLGVPMSS